jgi:hypothetical protein
MLEYYPGVARDDPEQSLIAGARTMKHYLTVFEGDAHKALAAYNAGLGRVQSLVAAHGEDWERALPAETKGYLAAIVGETSPTVVVDASDTIDPAVFGGLRPGGVLISPVDRVLDEHAAATPRHRGRCGACTSGRACHRCIRQRPRHHAHAPPRERLVEFARRPRGRSDTVPAAKLIPPAAST